MNRDVERLSTIAMRALVRSPKRALTPETIGRADAVVLKHAEGRQYIKQEVIDALIRDSRLLNETLPSCFFEKDQRRLSFRGAAKITEQLLDTVCQVTAGLEYLDISGCFQLQDSAVAVVLRRCPSLRSLKCENCRKMTDGAIDHMIQLGSALCAVHLGGNFNMTNEGIMRLITLHPNRNHFKELHVSGLPFTSEALEALIPNCPKVRNLGIGYSETLEETTLLSLLRQLRLRKLHAHWCQKAVTDQVLDVIASECQDLEELNICGVKTTSAAAVEQLLQQVDADTAGDITGDGLLKRKSESGSKGSKARRLRRLKIRYVGNNRQAVQALEDEWGDDVEFVS